MKPEIDQVAAQWVARRYAGLSAEEETLLARWLAADPLHAAAFSELEKAWTMLDRVRAPALEAATPDPDALAPRRTRSARWAVPMLAAAAALAVLAWTGYDSAPRAPLDFSTDVATVVGDVRKFDLPDGSVVRLNTDTRVQVRFAANERRVQLMRGEAHFTVATNLRRPFFVEVGNVAVRAVGTAFNVRLREGKVEVLVTEGRVRVDETVRGEPLLASRVSLEPPHLVAGERAVVPLEGPGRSSALPPAPITVDAPEVERALAWQERRIDVMAAPLGEIVAEFNRYNHHQLVIPDPALAARRFGGSFRADEPETFVRLLQLRFGLQVERTGGTTTLR